MRGEEFAYSAPRQQHGTRHYLQLSIKVLTISVYEDFAFVLYAFTFNTLM